MLNNERESQRARNTEEKDRTELRLKGGYERIYPVLEQVDLQARYDFLITASREVWGE
jgi:hypothetical protein